MQGSKPCKAFIQSLCNGIGSQINSKTSVGSLGLQMFAIAQWAK